MNTRVVQQQRNPLLKYHEPLTSMTVFCYAKPPILSIVKRKGYLCHLPAQKFLLHVLWQAA